MANLILSSIMCAKRDELATLKELQFSKNAIVLSISLEPDVDTVTGDATDCLVGDLES